MSHPNPNPKPYMPIYVYPDGNPIPVQYLPQDTYYKWVERYGGGGQQLDGPARMGDMRPDGKPGHGGVATIDQNGRYIVEYHGTGQMPFGVSGPFYLYR